MMRFFHAALCAFSLLSVSQSAPATSCDHLIQPLEDNVGERLLGKWFHVAESSSHKAAEVLTKKFQENFWCKITAANETDAINIEGSSKVFGLCLTATVQMALEKNTIKPKVPETSSKGNETTGEKEPERMLKLLKTGCSDCLLIQTPEYQFGGTRLITSLALLSKTGTVTPAELKEFEKQSECLNLRKPFSLSSKGDVCPELPSQDTEFPDLPRIFVNGQEADLLNLMTNITDAIGGEENLQEMINQIVSEDI